MKFQFFGLKSFVMGFKLKEIVFYSLVFTRYNYTSRLCTFFRELSPRGNILQKRIMKIKAVGILFHFFFLK